MPEFDDFSASYDDLLRDPVRERFTSGDNLFFHVRKRDVIREYFRRRGTATRGCSYLDAGCGRGELLSLLREDFGRVAGCDPSGRMMESGGLAGKGIETRIQEDPGRLPYGDGEFDFVTAVCVFHHVPPAERAGLLGEMRRVLRPGGTLAVIEHNPYNPATRLIVSRTPVDADAMLLPPGETQRRMREAGAREQETRFFLYLPEPLFARFGWCERALGRVPLGGQYAVFGR